MLKKNRKSLYRQVACVTSNRQNAQDILDYVFNGIGYIYWFGDYYAVYSK